MSVYVDNAQHRYGRMVMCHMVADSPEELRSMAARIGVAYRWLQKPGTPHEHFDVCKTKRALAVRYGAVEIDHRGLAAIFRAKRGPRA